MATGANKAFELNPVVTVPVEFAGGVKGTPITYYLSRDGNTGDLYLDVGSVSNSVVGVPLARAARVTAIACQLSAVVAGGDMVVRVREVGAVTDYAILTVTEGNDHAYDPSPTALVDFAAGDALRVYIDTSASDDVADPVVSVELKHI